MFFVTILLLSSFVLSADLDWLFSVGYSPGNECSPDTWIQAQEIGPIGNCFAVDNIPYIWFTTYCGQEGHYGLYEVFMFKDQHCTQALENYSIPYFPECVNLGYTDIKGDCRMAFPEDGVMFTTFHNSSDKCQGQFGQAYYLKKDACVITPEAPEDGLRSPFAANEIQSIMTSCPEPGHSVTTLFSDDSCGTIVEKVPLKAGDCSPLLMHGQYQYIEYNKGC